MNDAVNRSWRASPRWMKLLLILSLTANFVVIGVAAGAAFHMRDFAHGGSRGMERLIGALPEARQDAARRIAEEAAPAMQAAREERRESRRAYAAALAAAPYDEAAFDAALDRMVAARQASRIASHQLVKEIAADLTDAERATLAEGLNRRRGGRWRHRPPRGRGE